MRIGIEDLTQDKIKDVDYWLVTEEDPAEANLSATSVDEAIDDWKERVDDDPENVFGSEGEWEKWKANPDARITVTAYKRCKITSAKDILFDTINRMEENDLCDSENNYCSYKPLLEAAEKFREALVENIDPWYYQAFDVLCWLNKPNVVKEK